MNPGSETFQVNLTRAQGQPWGFRLQGGKDFTIPLSVQSVNPGSIAEQAGLKAGDAVLQINNRPSDELEHEQAKQEIVASGNNVRLVVQRGVVKIWKPKVTPMSELAPQGVQLLPSSVTDGDNYIQKTSLAADKPDALHIGSAHNRTARPFGSSFGGSAGTSGPVNAQYNTPLNLYSAENAAETYKAQSAALQADMSNLSVTDVGSSAVQPPRGPSPVTISLPADANSSQILKRRVSPAFLTVTEAEPSNLAVRSVSPTFLAVKQLESTNNNSSQQQSAVYQDVKDGEEIRYLGYTNPRKQSRSFQLLEQGLGLTEGEPGTGGAGVAGSSGIRSVKAPVFDPSQHEIQQAQHMTCKACGTLIIGVFVRIKGEPMHPECFKCAKCGKNLKNQGYFTIEGRMYCETDAKLVSQAGAGQDMYAVPVYR
jgi:membrane-associated protease RseP (regulator of RpoE activity)/ribosomal protein L37AE/L43A